MEALVVSRTGRGTGWKGKRKGVSVEGSHTFGNGAICDDGRIDGQTDGNQISGRNTPSTRRTGNLLSELRLYRMLSIHSRNCDRTRRIGKKRMPRRPTHIVTLDVQANDGQKTHMHSKQQISPTKVGRAPAISMAAAASDNQIGGKRRRIWPDLFLGRNSRR